MSQSSLPTGPLTLALFKFSYATYRGLQAVVPWTHVPERSNLFVVFDDVRSRENNGLITTTKLLKIVCGGEVLVC